MKTVTLALNPLEPDSWTLHEVQDVRDFLMEQFNEWPATARIYHQQVSSSHDVTPACEADIDRLGKLEGPFYVIVYPGEPITIIYAIVAVIVVAAVVMAAQAKVPNAALRNTQNQSPNNELSERSNKPRPMSRIPDIYGTVRSTPDLIAVPYKIFQSHEEVEYAYMCLGRGAYEVSDVRDDTTLAVDIAGTSVEVYAPMTSPNSGHAPQLRIGAAINTPILDVKRSNSVNGQVLRPPNDQNIRGANNIRFVAPNEIQTSAHDFTDKFAAGDVLTVANAVEYTSYANETRAITAYNTGAFRFPIPSATLPALYAAGKECVLTGALFSATDPDGFWSTSYDLSGIYTIQSVSHESEVITPEVGAPYTQNYCRVQLVNPAQINPKWNDATGLTTDVGIRIPDGELIYDLSGVYTVLAVSDTSMTLSNPASVNPAWSTITTTSYVSPILFTSGPKWIGPFILESNSLNQVYANFVSLNGLYKDDGKNQIRMDVTIELEVTPVNADGSARGAVQTFQATIEGSATYRSTRAVTLKASLAVSGRCKIRARRVTPSDLAFEGSVVDEVKWRDVYSVAPVALTDFGNVTTVHSVTYATAGALALKERKLNMLATRKIPVRVDGSTFTTELYATNRADHIFSAVCLDPYIGNRPATEIDFDNIYSAVAEVRSYFGTDLAGEFSYTFDSDNLSFEEIAQAVANAVFCTAYRRGNIIKMNFERATDDSTILFNHRNKLPGSETRTVRFGNQNNFDGVSYKYADPNDDAIVTYYIPEDMSAINPREIESIGVRTHLQAYFHAWRNWNKIKYQNVITEFQATQEAELLVPQDRILVADNTRSKTQDGEVLSQELLQLKLSQPVVMDPEVNYSIFLQHIDGTVESISVTPGVSDRHVILARAPRLPLALEDGLYARTVYILAGNDEPRENAFLVVEKEPQSNFTSTVRAVNYDARYYSKDKDFFNGVVNSDGVPL